MAMPIRVKTIWFKKDGERSADEIASAVATTTWRVADKAIDNLGRENYDIITPIAASSSSPSSSLFWCTTATAWRMQRSRRNAVWPCFRPSVTAWAK